MTLKEKTPLQTQKKKLQGFALAQKNLSKELMQEYSLSDLKKRCTLNLSLGDIVCLKGLAIRKGFTEIADVLRLKEKQILSKSKKK